MNLDVPFALRERPGLIRVRVEANTDPEDLGHPLVAVGYERESFLGFPSVEARVQYDGQGPRAFMGWLQVVERRDDDGNAAVEVDAVPVFGEESPLYTFGYAPTLADFPANPTHPNGSWTAFAFLVAIPDVIRSRRLEVITGFRWGYRLRQGKPEQLFAPRPVAAGKWNELRDLLASSFPSWSFLPEQK